MVFCGVVVDGRVERAFARERERKKEREKERERERNKKQRERERERERERGNTSTTTYHRALRHALWYTIVRGRSTQAGERETDTHCCGTVG